MLTSKSPQPPSLTLPSMDTEPELRAAKRIPAAEVPAITGLRISPHGAEALLVNISETGLLADCGDKVQPGSSVMVIVEGTFSPSSIPARVVRTAVAAFGQNGRLRYHLGIVFDTRIDLDGHKNADAAKPVVPVPIEASPRSETTVLRNRW